MRIDVHAHYNPPSLVDANVKISGSKPLGIHPVGLEARVEAMDKAGVDLQLLWPTLQPNFPDLAASRDFARLTNDTYREQSDRHPGRFSGWGCIPLPHVDAALAEMEYCLDEAGFPGIGLGCSANGLPLDAPEFEPVWAELNRREAAVFIHPGQVRSGMPGAQDFGLTVCLSSPMEIALAGARLVLSGLTKRHAKVKIILATGGGVLPYINENIAYAVQRHPDPTVKDPEIDAGLRKFYYDTSVSKDSKKLSRLCQMCGMSHILFGTDAPFGSMEENIDMVQKHFSKGDADLVLDQNAQDLLGIHP